MDKEIVYINNILVNSIDALTTSDISKLIFERYEAKVSRTIVKNYLWSYFRDIIKYDSSEYTYKINNDGFLIDDITVEQNSNLKRPVSANFEGSKIKVVFDNNISIDTYIQAIAIMNFKTNVNKKNTDLLKHFNRIVEQINQEND
jgi:hypothetical protein